MTDTLIHPEWPASAGVRAVVTTRLTGDAAAFADGGDAMAMLRRKAGLPADPVWPRQVHGTTVVAAHKATGRPVADAAWTDRPGVPCAVQTADCLPVLLCDRAGTRVAAVHAGWRGLAAGVIECTVDALGVSSSELLAWMGPAIGPAAFEVGPEVRECFLQRDPGATAAFTRGRDDRWMADLYRIARRRLNGLGVKDVRGGGFCTYSDPDRFYSFRRDGQTGRMAALIWLEGR